MKSTLLYFELFIDIPVFLYVDKLLISAPNSKESHDLLIYWLYFLNLELSKEMGSSLLLYL